MPIVGMLDGALDMVWSAGVGTATSVPVPYIIAVNNHTYLEDLEFKPWKRQAMRFTTTTITRTQADTSNEPGEQSLSTQSLWRRTQDSWHLGAGQVYIDRKNSSEFQYRSSKGVYPWQQWQLSLLKDTTHSLTSANTNLDLVVCNGTVYVIDGQNLKFSTNLSSWTTVTGTPAVTASSICSDGHTVYVAYGASGIYSTTEGNASASQYTTSAINASAVVRFVMGRLMLATGTSIYNITASGALPGSPLFTSNYSNFVWTDFAEGLGVIYAAGNSGDKAVIYGIGITSDATTLAQPIVRGQVPYGETINCIQGYIGGTMAIGTSAGFRFAEQATTAGDLNIGPLIGPNGGGPANVTSFSPYDRFIWFTWTNYDGVSTGLGRMDPSQFTADLTPAFASDLMVTAQATVTSVIHFGGAPTFGVSGSGVWTQASTYVTSGTLSTGLITYGLADNKMPVFVDLTMQSLVAGTISPAVSLNSGLFTTIGTVSLVNQTSAEFNTPQTLSSTIEIQETITSGSSNTVTPVLTRHTLRSVPAPSLPTDLFVVIQMRERMVINDTEFTMVPSQEWIYLNSLCQSKQINTVQIGNMGPFSATLENIDWIPEQKNFLDGELNGVCVLNFRTVV